MKTAVADSCGRAGQLKAVLRGAATFRRSVATSPVFRSLPCRLVSLVLVLLVLTLAAPPAHAEFPYDQETGRETALLVSGAVLFGAGLWAGSGLAPLTPEEIAVLDRCDVPALDRGATRRWSPGAATASDILVYATLAAPIGLIASEPGRDDAVTSGLMYAETLTLEMSAVYLLKGAVGRTRPYVYNDDPRIDPAEKQSATAVRSFPSGHAANAFAAMVFFAGTWERLHPDASGSGWVWGGCLAVAATTSYLRYAAGRHYPTDILAGAAIGAAAGWLVPKLHERDLVVSGAPGQAGGKAPLVIGYGLSF